VAKDDTLTNRSIASAGKTYSVDMEIQQLRQSIYGMSGLQDRLQNSTKSSRAAIQKDFDAAYEKLTALEAQREKLLADDKKAAQADKDKNSAAARTKAANKAADLEDKAKAADLAKNPKLASSLRAQANQERAKAKAPKVENTGGPMGAPLPLTDEQIVANEFSKANVDAQGIVQYGFPGKDGEGLSAMQAYIYVEPSKKGGTAYSGSGLYTSPDQDKSFAFGTSDEVANKYYTQLVKQYGSKTALAQKLQEAGKLSNAKTADRGKILTALDGVIATYTADNTIAIKNGEIKELPTMDEYLTGMRGKAGGNSYTKTDTVIYDETTATKDLNQVARALTGKDYPKEKLSEGIKILQMIQKKMPQKTTYTQDEQGRQVATTTKTGVDPQGFLIQQVSQMDAAKEKQVLDYYSVFKNSFGVR
jgi:hypothetical protein